MSRNGSVLPHAYSHPGSLIPLAEADRAFSQEREGLSIAYRRSRLNTTDVFSAEQVQEPWMPHPAAPRVALKTNGKILLLDPADISAAEAQGNYVLIHRNGSSHLLRERISVVAEKLQAFGLLRIHRSVLVNAAHVEAVRPTTSGEYLLRMRGGKEYTVSRTYKSNLQHLATIWIGTDGFPEGDSLQEETLI